MIEQLQARVKEIEEAVDKSAANHNVLVGRLTELRDILAGMQAPKADAVVEYPVNSIESEVVNVVDDVAPIAGLE